jgi:biopolymer transport protein ExbD
VAVTRGQVLVDGTLVGAVDDAGERLTELLRRKRELWSSFHPARPFPGVVLLEVDQNLPYGSVARLTRACGAAGYATVSFIGVTRHG